MYAAVCTAVGTHKVAKSGTILDYAVTLTNGKMAVPSNSTLSVTTSLSTFGNITCSSAGADVPLDTAILTNPALAANAVVICNFAVNVTDAEKTSGSVPAITVTAAFGLAASDMIFSIPAATTAAVSVFNGASYIVSTPSLAVTGPSVTGAARNIRFMLHTLPATCREPRICMYSLNCRSYITHRVVKKATWLCIVSESSCV